MDIAQQDLWIRERAYWLWEEEGRPDGRELDHWFRASSEIAGAAPITARAEAAAERPEAKPRKTTAKTRARKTLQ